MNEVKESVINLRNRFSLCNLCKIYPCKSVFKKGTNCKIEDVKRRAECA